MMNILLNRSLLLFLLCLCGCGTGAATAPPPAASELGKSAQTNVNALLEEIQKSPTNAVNRLAVMQESFDSYAANYQGKFVEVATATKDLKALYEKKAGAAEIKQGQERLKAAADAAAQ